MRIIFMGTPEFAVPTLQALAASVHEIVAVYTQPPRRAGRGKALTPSPVQRVAEALGIAVRSPASLKSPQAQADFAACDAELAVVAAYGLILPQAILSAPQHGCINVHASLLPRWRGAAPIQRAILAGDAMTGVTIMQMEAGLDTGPMLAKAESVVGHKTAGALTNELAQRGADLLVQVLGDLASYAAVTQPEAGVTYAPKVDKSEALLDFLVSAPQVERQIRAFNPAPGAYFEVGGERVRVLAAEVVAPLPQIAGALGTAPASVLDDQLTIACNPGAIRLTSVQRAGRGVMSAQELLRGFPIAIGTKLA